MEVLENNEKKMWNNGWDQKKIRTDFFSPKQSFSGLAQARLRLSGQVAKNASFLWTISMDEADQSGIDFAEIVDLLIINSKIKDVTILLADTLQIHNIMLKWRDLFLMSSSNKKNVEKGQPVLFDDGSIYGNLNSQWAIRDIGINTADSWFKKLTFDNKSSIFIDESHLAYDTLIKGHFLSKEEAEKIALDMGDNWLKENKIALEKLAKSGKLVTFKRDKNGTLIPLNQEEKIENILLTKRWNDYKGQKIFEANLKEIEILFEKNESFKHSVNICIKNKKKQAFNQKNSSFEAQNLSKEENHTKGKNSVGKKITKEQIEKITKSGKSYLFEEAAVRTGLFFEGFDYELYRHEFNSVLKYVQNYYKKKSKISAELAQIYVVENKIHNKKKRKSNDIYFPELYFNVDKVITILLLVQQCKMEIEKGVSILKQLIQITCEINMAFSAGDNHENSKEDSLELYFNDEEAMKILILVRQNMMDIEKGVSILKRFIYIACEINMASHNDNQNILSQQEFSSGYNGDSNGNNGQFSFEKRDFN